MGLATPSFRLMNRLSDSLSAASPRTESRYGVLVPRTIQIRRKGMPGLGEVSLLIQAVVMRSPVS